MRNFEVFNNREAILKRLDELKQEGISESEIEVFNSKEEEQEYLRGLGLEIYREDDGFVPLFTKQPDEEEIAKYDITKGDLDEASEYIEAGDYILRVNRENYYDNFNGGGLDNIDFGINNSADRKLENGSEKIVLHEERLRVNKERVQTGQVKVNKSTVTENQELDVDYERDDVIVKRVLPGTTDKEAFGDSFEGEVTRIPVYGEKIIITKEKVLEEEIVILKKTVRESEKIVEPVRKEVIEIVDEN